MTVNIGQVQGAGAQRFNVIDHHGVGAYPYAVCATVTPDYGALVYFTGKNIVSICSGGVGANYAGFCDPKVVTDANAVRLETFGDIATVSADNVAIWRKGRYFQPLVIGVVGNNVPVYPAATAGYVQATQIASDLIVGIAREGNNSVSGDPIVIEIDFSGHTN